MLGRFGGTCSLQERTSSMELRLGSQDDGQPRATTVVAASAHC